MFYGCKSKWEHLSRADAVQIQVDFRPNLGARLIFEFWSDLLTYTFIFSLYQ